MNRHGVQSVGAGKERAEGIAVIGHKLWTWVRLAGGAAVLAVLVADLGTGPFVQGLQRISPAVVAVAVTTNALTTLCCAWRWRLVAEGLGLDVPLAGAVTACYRAHFLNLTLPGGVLGDVDRAVDRGLRTGEMSRTVRSVAWERSLGQVVQVALTAVALLALPSVLRSPALLLVAAAPVAAVTALVLLRHRLARSGGMLARGVLAVLRDLSAIVRVRGAVPGIVLASVGVTLGHAAVFVVAVRAAGLDLSAAAALPLALVVLLAGAIPLSIAGWGAREGAAAWTFGVAGLGAAQGVTVSVLYGVLALVATLPGALTLVAWGRRAPAAVPQEVSRG